MFSLVRRKEIFALEAATIEIDQSLFYLMHKSNNFPQTYEISDSLAAILTNVDFP